MRHEARARVGLSALAGVAFALATPPANATFLAPVALAIVAWVLEAPTSAKRAWLDGAARGLAFGFGVSLVAHRFVPRVIARFTPLPFAAGVVALVLLALAQGLPWAAAGMARSALVRARVPRPMAYAIAVYASAFVPAIFPWTPAAGITRWPAMIQLADTIGERGVAMLVALFAGCVAHAVRFEKRRAIVTGAAIAIPIAIAAHGVLRMRAIDRLRDAAPSIRVGLVQPSIDATTRWEGAAAPSILTKLTALTRVAESHGAQITVWPESAYPYTLARGAKSAPASEQRPVQDGVHGPLLVGAITIDAASDRYNAVLGARADGAITSEYDKLHLLWFGEEVPLAGTFPWLRRTFARGLGLVPGESPAVVDTGRVKAGVLICFEDILPDAGREAAGVHPNLIVNVSNDAWFTGSSESALHMQMSTLRAVEARRDLVRAVNEGATSFVDAAGRVRAEKSDDVPGSLVITAALLEGEPTFYAAWGDGPGIALCVIVALGCLLRKRSA